MKNLAGLTEEEQIPMEFESSHGILLVNRDGSINEGSDFDTDCWLSDISKVDIEELDNYYKIQTAEVCDGGDVLDFGWWDKKGKYHKPDKDWRKETFHSQELSKKEVRELLKLSSQWIKENRV